MSKTQRIIIAIIGGCATGGLSACSIVWPDLAIVFAPLAGVVATSVALLTGYNIGE